MKNLLFTMFMIFTCITGFSQLDPGYITKFGYSSLIASGKGYPESNKFDPAQFNFKDNKFYIAPGANTTINLRAILPQGMTLGKCLEKVEKTYPANLKFRTDNFIAFCVWSSHDRSGKNLVDATHPWPQKISDEPKWTEWNFAYPVNLSDESKTWSSVGCEWGNEFERDMKQILEYGIEGQKLYILMRVGYSYNNPDARIEKRWNANTQQYENITLSGIGDEYGEPIVACTIEFLPNADITVNLKDNGNGTVNVTDIAGKTDIIWLQSPDATQMDWDQAMTYTENLNYAGFSDWRLPTIDEFKALIKLRPENNHTSPFEWFNANGFKNVQKEDYWTLTESADPMEIQMFSAQGGGYEPTHPKSETGYYSWAVRTDKSKQGYNLVEIKMPSQRTVLKVGDNVIFSKDKYKDMEGIITGINQFSAKIKFTRKANISEMSSGKTKIEETIDVPFENITKK